MQYPDPARVPRVSRRRALIALGCAGALSAGVAAVGSPISPVSAADGDTKIQILSFNDFHGHVESGTPGSIDGSFRGPAAGGAEFLSAKLTELRGERVDGETFTVAAGDLIGGSPFFSGLFHDEPSVESLNAMGLDFSGVGNHEFDEGVAELLRMQNGGNHPVDGGYFDDYDASTPEIDEFGGADFQWLAANVTEIAPDGVDDFEDSIPDYTIETAADGKKIAFIGMTLEGTDELVSASGIAGFTFDDEIVAGNAAVTAIKNEDPTVEAIIVMLHEGGIPTPFAINGCAGISGPINTIAEGLDAEIDAIVTGHTHQPYTCSLDDPEGDPRPVTSAFSFGRVVTEITLELDDQGEVDRDTFEMFNHPVLQNLPTDDPEVFEDAATDPAVTAIIDRWSPLASDVGAQPVGTIIETIARGGDPAGSDRGVESAAGNLVADAQLAATAEIGAVVAFMNPGGVRTDLVFEANADVIGDAEGVVTFGEAFEFQPFNNTMFVLPMTGAQIISVLEEQCQPGGSSRPVLHLGVSDGFTYDLELTLQDGVCTAVDVSNVQLNGVDLVDDDEYLVAVNNFLAEGGDNFNTFAEVEFTDQLPGPQDIDALTDYFEANPALAAPSTDRVDETITTLQSSLVSVDPARLIDTRTGENNVTTDGEDEGAGRIDAGTEVELKVTERGNVSSDADAVQLNIGVITPSDSGFVTVYPCGADRPQASNINFDSGATVSNAVFSGVGDDGAVCIYTSAEAHLIADVTSYVPAGGSPVALDPARLLETRTGENNTTTDGEFQGDDRVAAGETVQLDVTERGGVPADATAVVLNVGAVRPSADGFVTVYTCGEDLPQASNVNYVDGGVVSNSVTAQITDGEVCIYTSAETHLIADVNGYVPVGGSPVAIEPARLLETRDTETAATVDGTFEGDGPVGIDGVELTVAGRGGVPAGAATVSLNVGAIRPDGKGFITVYPCGEDRPQASNVNFEGGDIISNAVSAKVGEDGKVCIYSSVPTEMIVDVTAAVTPPVPAFPGDDS